MKRTYIIIETYFYQFYFHANILTTIVNCTPVNLLSVTWQIHTDTGSADTSNNPLFKKIEFFRLFEVVSSASTFQAQIPYPQKDMSSQVAKKLKVVTTSTENTAQITWVISSRRRSSMIFFANVESSFQFNLREETELTRPPSWDLFLSVLIGQNSYQVTSGTTEGHTVFEIHRKCLIQHCERSELRLLFWLDKSSSKMPKVVNFGEFLNAWS